MKDNPSKPPRYSQGSQRLVGHQMKVKQGFRGRKRGAMRARSNLSGPQSPQILVECVMRGHETLKMAK